MCAVLKRPCRTFQPTQYRFGDIHGKSWWQAGLNFVDDGGGTGENVFDDRAG